MFFALYKDENGNERGNIYFENDSFFKDTFNPETEVITVLPFSVSGNTYREKKNSARQLAIDYSEICADRNFSYGELAAVCSFFEIIGERFGLLKEFRENAII